MPSRIFALAFQIMANEKNAAIKQDVHKPMIVWGFPMCSLPKSSAVYDNRFGGGKSTKAIVVTVPIPSLGLTIETAIYGRLAEKSDGTEIRFEAAVPKGMSFESDAARDVFLATAENGAAGWNGFEGATKAAENRLLGVETKATSPEQQRPRLVKRVVAASTTAETTVQ